MTTEKHAFLLQVRLLDTKTQRLVHALDGDNHDIFIHVDAKSGAIDQELVRQEVASAKIYFVPRVAVSWAAYSQVEAELSLLSAATEQDQYHYYHLLSESDYPVKNMADIDAFFHGRNEEFVEFENVDLQNSINRIKYYYPLQERLGKRHGFPWAMQKLLLIGERIVRIDRLRQQTAFEHIGKGANWFSITDDFARYIVAQRQLIKQRFDLARAPDEVFVQTLLLNSDFRGRVATRQEANMRFVRWIRGNSPEYLTPDDWPQIRDSGKLFARKIDDSPDGWALRDLIDRRVSGGTHDK